MEVQAASMREAVREVEVVAVGLEECLLQRLQGIILDLVEFLRYDAMQEWPLEGL